MRIRARKTGFLSYVTGVCDAMVRTQAQITGFLSPVATGPQSLPCGQVNPCPTCDAHSVSGMSSKYELPQRNRGKKSKKVLRVKSKAKRKHEKNARKKHDKSRTNSPVRTAITPLNNCHNDPMRIDESSLLMDRRLRDMLASGDEQSLDNDVNESCEMLNQQ